ncbi:hypothetical protein [Weissella viridescens]|uniref:hypothetical protein n=1 Tax=Weissella viridescens TaxID=1629 RepID=UPI0011CF46B4|nr:hypothetical protein [Weissella viridescens]
MEFDKIMFSPDGSVDLLVEGELWEDSDEQGGNVFIVERYTGVNDSENNPVFVPFANANLQKMK